MSGGIFCIENWSGRLVSRDTVRPILEFLEEHDAARFIHQPVQTRQELGYYLSRFAELSTYPVGYLAMHGNAGGVYVGEERVKLETLSAWTTPERAPKLDRMGRPEDWVLDLTGKVLYLDSCAALRVTQQRLHNLREATGLRMICGYTKSIDWFDSAGFDVILLSALAQAMDGKDQQRRLRRSVTRLWQRAGDLMDTLGFTSDPDWRP